MKLLIAFLLILAYKLISNFFFYRRIVHLKKIYFDYIESKNNDLLEYKSEIIDLFQKANVKDKIVVYTEPVGYGYISNSNVSVFNNIQLKDDRFVARIINSFDESISVFKYRCKQCFNPIYWIQTLIYLPKHIFEFLGLDTSTLVSKILQLIYWILGFIYGIYNNQIDQFIQKILSIIWRM